MNNREALEKLESIDAHTPEAMLIKHIIQNLILLEDRLYVIEKKIGIK